jgi:hypothetical protein
MHNVDTRVMSVNAVRLSRVTSASSAGNWPGAALPCTPLVLKVFNIIRRIA